MAPGESLPDEAKRLVAFIGEWDVTGSMSDGTDQFPVTGRWMFTEAIDGWGVNGIMVTDIEGMGSFEESELIGLDAVTGEVHMFSMNKFTIRDHVGGWEDDHTLVTRYAADDGGTRTVEVITVTFHDLDRMTGSVVEQVDGETVLTTDLRMRKQA